jgi:ferredoxin-NADP reductase
MLRIETAEGERAKPFSYASSPTDPWIEMTTRVSGSPFKQALVAMAEGDAVELRGPAGRFGLAEEVTRPVFLAGGVGITPVMSILRHARDTRRPLDAVLLYGNVSEECIPYEAELAAMERLVETVHVIERPGPAWEGESGFISASIVAEHVEDVFACGYYVTGPPVMVEAMTGVLDELEIPAGQRHVERFGSPAA